MRRCVINFKNCGTYHVIVHDDHNHHDHHDVLDNMTRMIVKSRGDIHVKYRAQRAKEEPAMKSIREECEALTHVVATWNQRQAEIKEQLKEIKAESKQLQDDLV
jgi:hypothetical protein